MKYRYHHLHLICSDLEETIHFFTGILGAELVARRKFGTADGASLDLNGTAINLRLAGEGEEVADYGTGKRFGYHHLALEVEDLDAVYRELSGKGVEFTLLPQDGGGVMMAFIKGPDNIAIELVQPIE